MSAFGGGGSSGPAPDNGPQSGSTSMFVIFALAVYTLVLIPYTLVKLRSAGKAEDDVDRPWEAASKGGGGASSSPPTPASRFLAKARRVRALRLALLWAAWIALLSLARAWTVESTPFDPWDILQVPRGADEKAVRRAYRGLSLQYHPDKNPDPAAATYFAEYITKAYKALTDETARENYEKHGHPDGPQGMRMNIALPEWMFVSDAATAPVVLAVLVFGCILAPLAGAAFYILSAAKKRSETGVAPETTELFVRSKWAVKEQMSLPRVQDTLVMAYEFIMMPTPKSQEEALQALARTLMKGFPDLKEGHPFWKRRPSIVKVHMLLMAHCGREPVPAALAADLETVLRRSPTFLEEMLKIGNIPRVQGWPYGWAAPTIGCLEMMQCLNQAVPFFVKKPSIGGSRTSLKSSDIPLAILPHMVTGPDMEPVKRLARHKPPLRTPADLARLSDDDLAAALTGVAGLTPHAASDVFACLQAMPDLAMSPAVVGIQGDDDDELEGVDGASPEAALPRPGDILTVSFRALLRRRSHRAPGARPPTKPVVAFTPYLPPSLTRRERWWVIVADLSSNTCFAVAPVDLRAAEAAAFDVPAAAAEEDKAGDSPSASGSSRAPKRRASTPSPEDEAALAAEFGAQVDVRFEAPKADKYNLTVMLVTDAWVGCDRSVPARLRVVEATRAELEGRARRGGGGGGCCGGAHAAPAAAATAAKAAAASGDDIAPASDAGSDSESEEEWDSEESGTEESGSDAERDVAAARAGTRTLAAGGGGGGKGRGSSAQAKADGTAAAQAAAAGEIGSADSTSSASSSDDDDDDSSDGATPSSSSPSAGSAGGTTTTTSTTTGEDEESEEATTSSSSDGSAAAATSSDGSEGAVLAKPGSTSASPSGDGAVEEATDEE